MKSSLKFTTIALLLGGVLNMPCLSAADTAPAPSSLADDALERRAPILSSYENTEAGMTAFAQFANENAAQKGIRATLRTEVSQPDSLPLPFFVSAFEKAKAGKNLISFLIGVKTQSLDSLAARSASQARIAALEEELGRTTASLAAERATLKLTVSATPAVVVTPEELPAFLVMNPAKRTPRDPSDLAGTISVLAVRAALGTPDLPRVLSTLETIETHLKHVVADAKGDELTTAVARVHSFATLRSQLSVMAPQIQAFLTGHTTAHDAIQPKVLVPGRLYHTYGFDTEQQLLQAEHMAGKNIALGVYDEVFQTATTSEVVFPVALNRSGSELIVALRTLLPRTITPVTSVVVRHDGLVLGIASSDTVNEALTVIRGKTHEFLSWAMGARIVVGSQGLQGFETAELARTSLAPVVAPPPVVIEADEGAAPSGESSAVFVQPKTDETAPTADAPAAVDGSTVEASVALQQPPTTDASAS